MSRFLAADGCVLCFAQPGQPVEHIGDHLIQSVYGGRASCPIDEADDPDLLEECAWVALEEALTDIGWDLPGQQALASDAQQLVGRVTDGVALRYAGHAVEWERRLDEHLAEDATTCEVICTITAPLKAVTQEQLEARLFSRR
jgi:hypothetical protein